MKACIMRDILAVFPVEYMHRNPEKMIPFPAVLFIGLILMALLLFAMLRYMTNMPGDPYAGTHQSLSSDEEFLKTQLEEHVFMLSHTIGERNIWHYERLVTAANYIERTFRNLGYDVAKQEYQTEKVPVWNIAAEIAGSSRPEEIILVGAHYDSVIGSPGANDNASGVAALLEMARLMKMANPSRTIRFVAFVNEEPPFFQTGDMGSRRYSSFVRARNENILAMFSLETIGWYSDMQGSQKYPFPLSWFYPATGNFLAFVGNIPSRSLVHRTIGVFRTKTAFPSEGISAPGWITGIDWSDHWSFWEEGYPAVMVTDTALFRYDFYHTAQDTHEKLNYRSMAQAVWGIFTVVKDLSGSGRLH